MPRFSPRRTNQIAPHLHFSGLITLCFAGLLATAPASAQWLGYKTQGIPRLEDGSADMAAKAPRMPSGKPDFSGTWTSDEIDPRNPSVGANPLDATPSRRMINLGVELEGGLPYKPWMADVVKERRANHSLDDPHVRCMPDNFLRSYAMPHLIKFVQRPELLVVLNEWNGQFRQIFIDGREFPEEDNVWPSWQGYSTAKWDGDTLIVDTIGVRDHSWIDWSGSEVSDVAKIREEFTRPDFGHMRIKVTVDDPKGYTEPWTVEIRERLIVDTGLIEETCLENEKSLEHMQ